MTQHYDGNLRYRIPANNGDSRIVLNRNFSQWNDHIVKNLEIRDGHDRYEKGPDKKLLVQCQEHAREYQRPNFADCVVMLTHPFYMHLSHMGSIENKGVQREAKEYLDNLLKLLNLHRDRSKVGVVVLDTLHHYAAVTSLFLEMGVLDQVMFTEYDNGTALEPIELTRFKRSRIFFGGGYNGKCLSTTIINMSEISLGEIWAIDGLVLNSPQDYKNTIRPKKVDVLNKSRMMPLDDVVTLLGLRH